MISHKKLWYIEFRDFILCFFLCKVNANSEYGFTKCSCTFSTKCTSKNVLFCLFIPVLQILIDCSYPKIGHANVRIERTFARKPWNFPWFCCVHPARLTQKGRVPEDAPFAQACSSFTNPGRRRCRRGHRRAAPWG